ncbi:hypothetical protein QWM81_13550 [Streptomyces ficellus]|uniref:DMT family transporter n=1 Tax=Streptomyces ficellus TaxID=1977088 RepID=A0ABT7Z6G6_9ACTN|nr:hypothetical protein [Streptomyces ficellus]MDN3295060.1 hypothetical protein [Streptomyces ficellus]
MPIALIIASLMLQAGTEGYLTGRVEVGDSLLFSFAAFAVTSLVFTGALLLRRALGGEPVAPAPAHRPAALRLVLAMNVATAVTFLGFYVALPWVPAVLANSVMAGVGPLAVAVLDPRHRTSPAGWARAVALLAASLVVAAWTHDGGGAAGFAVLPGLLLVLLAGFGAAYIAQLSSRLAGVGAPPAWVTAHRFHLTYAAAALLLLTREAGPAAGGGLSLPATALAAIAGVTVPLYLLQIGLQRTRPVIAMVLLTTLPGLAYAGQVAFGDTFDPWQLAVVCAFMVLAGFCARAESRTPPAAVAPRPRPVTTSP